MSEWREHLHEIPGWNDDPSPAGLKHHLQLEGEVFPHPQNFPDETTYGKAFARWIRKNREKLTQGSVAEKDFASRPDVQLSSTGVAVHRHWSAT